MALFYNVELEGSIFQIPDSYSLEGRIKWKITSGWIMGKADVWIHQKLVWNGQVMCICVDIYGQDFLAPKSDGIGVSISLFWNSKRDSWCSRGRFRFLSWHTSDKPFPQHSHVSSHTSSSSFLLKVKLPRPVLFKSTGHCTECCRHHIAFGMLTSPQVESSEQSRRASHVLLANFSVEFLSVLYC